MINTPVLFIPYDRPDIARISFNAIIDAKPNKLYVFCDGVNNTRNNNQAIEENKKLINLVDWPCEVFTKFLNENLGAGKAVAEAINWVFDNEEYAIIIEEDCVATKSFFYFCEILLEKYQHDTRICMISGNNYTPKYNYTENSYFFSKYGHIWGWATWKRVWRKYDFYMKDWTNFKEGNYISDVFHNKKVQKYHVKNFDIIYSKKEKHTWDLQWYYCRIKDNGLSIVPKDNLVMNIGAFGANTQKKCKFHFIPTFENFKIIKHPDFILCNDYYDRHHFKNHIYKKKTIFKKMYNRFLKIMNIDLK